MPRTIVLALSTSEWDTAPLGGALCDDGTWQPLMAVDDFSLRDCPVGTHMENGARRACYIGVDLYLALTNLAVTKFLKLPQLEELVWSFCRDPRRPVKRCFLLPVWDARAKGHELEPEGIS